jgi:hypothetical protein
LEAMTRASTFIGQHRGLITILLCICLVGFLFALPPLGLSIYFMHIMIGVFIWIIVASSLRVLDLSGQGHRSAFMAIGATFRNTAKYLGWSPWVTTPIGILYDYRCFP